MSAAHKANCPGGAGQGAKQITERELNSNPTAYFLGSDNPRHLRVIAALLVRPRRREDIDSIGGASNGPELVAELRRRGLDVPCERVPFIDRDGKPCRPGVYSFTATDRRRYFAWMKRRTVKGGDHA